MRLCTLSEGPPPVSAARPLSKTQRRELADCADAVYRGFVAKVAAGRGLAEAEVRRHAQGRVWTGEQAHRRGLVDGLGGFEEAVRVACTAAGLGEQHAAGSVQLLELSKPSLLSSLGLAPSAAGAAAAAALAALAPGLGGLPASEALQALEGRDAEPAGGGVRLLTELPPELRLRDW